jgi:hypothetical protein
MAIAALDVPFQQLLQSESLPYAASTRREGARALESSPTPSHLHARATPRSFFAFDQGRTQDLRSNVTGFRQLGALKGTLVLRVLRAERHVLLSDVDVRAARAHSQRQARLWSPHRQSARRATPLSRTTAAALAFRAAPCTDLRSDLRSTRDTRR